LYLALDVKYITQDELRTAYDLAVEVKRMINCLIKYLKKGKSIAEICNEYVIFDEQTGRLKGMSFL
jgi:hypothetical protein